MDMVWIVLSFILIFGGIAGSILPLLPGPPLAFIGLLLLQLQSAPPFTSTFIWIWAGITLVVTLLDYYIPMEGIKRMGGTRWGVWGCTVGLIVGIFIPPWGIIAGPFLGALTGELLGNASAEHAWKAALGSFIGFLTGTLLKLIACFVMLYYAVTSLW